MGRILGIDPGSRLLGYGLIDSDGSVSRYVASGCLKVTGDGRRYQLRLRSDDGKIKPGMFVRATVVLERVAGATIVPGLVDAHLHPVGLAAGRAGVDLHDAADLADLITQLTDQMHTAAAELQFEMAARLRDEIAELKRELRGMAEAGLR